MSKKVYAAIELADQEVRLVVMEIFESRSNILRVERVACSGIQGNSIVDESSVVTAIREATKSAQAALGYRIERVILLIPAVNVKHSSQKVHVQIEDGTRTVRQFHIQQGYQKAIQKKMGDDVEYVNPNKITYLINGSETSKLPKGEECNDFYMYVDLLYASKETIFTFARCIEQANLEILDICLDVFAMGEETAALQQSIDRSIIQLSIEESHTELALFMDQKLMSVADLEKGFGWLIEPLKEKYRLSSEICYRLLQNVFSGKEEENSDVIVYIEQKEENRVEISAKELAEVVLPRLKEWIVEINTACDPIVRNGKTRYVLTGKGRNIPVLKDMETSFNAEAIVYEPSTIGARDGALIADLGAAYVWQDTNRIRQDDRISVNNNELEASIDSINQKAKDGDGGFTRKMKSVILSDKD